MGEGKRKSIPSAISNSMHAIGTGKQWDNRKDEMAENLIAAMRIEVDKFKKSAKRRFLCFRIFQAVYVESHEVLCP